MSFSISFSLIRLQEQAEQNAYAPGQIIISEFEESFLSSLSFWTKTQYQEHWNEAVTRLIRGEEKSALITSIPELEYANFISWWPMWRVHNTVYIQNQILFLNELHKPFDVSHWFDFVEDRQTQSEDGVLLSEWSLTLDDLINRV